MAPQGLARFHLFKNEAQGKIAVIAALDTAFEDG
jgi:hypothetical protein